MKTTHAVAPSRKIGSCNRGTGVKFKGLKPKKPKAKEEEPKFENSKRRSLIAILSRRIPALRQRIKEIVMASMEFPPGMLRAVRDLDLLNEYRAFIGKLIEYRDKLAATA